MSGLRDKLDKGLAMANAADVARLQAEAEADAPAYAEIEIHTPEDYAFADAQLTEVVRRKDAVIKMRQSAVGPLKSVVTTIEGWFRPVIKALEGIEESLKGKLGAYRLAAAEAEEAARKEAQAAAVAGNSEALIAALETAADVGAVAAGDRGRSGMRITWEPVVEDCTKVPREFMCVDTKALKALTKGLAKGAKPKVVPGVRWEKKGSISARR